MDSENKKKKKRPQPVVSNEAKVSVGTSSGEGPRQLQEENRRLTREIDALKRRLEGRKIPAWRSMRRDEEGSILPDDRRIGLADGSGAQPAIDCHYASSLLDAAPVSCTIWDRDGNLLDCNQETINLFGLKDKAEYINHFYNQFSKCQPNNESSRDMVMRITGDVLATGYQRFEWLSCTAAGQPLPLEITSVRIPWRNDYRIACYARDLREKEKHDRHVRPIEEGATILLDSAPLICTLWDVDGNLLDCNQGAVNILGLKDKRDMIENFYDRNPEYQPNKERSRDMARRIAREICATGYLHYEWMSGTKAGEQLPLESVSVLVPWKDGSRIISYSRDLRKIKAQERQTREAEERARLLLDTMPLGAVLWNQEHKALSCNQEILRMLGVADMDDYVARTNEFCPEIQPDGADSKKKLIARTDAAFATGYQKFEWMHRSSTGQPLPVEKTLVRVPWQGGWCVAAYTRDLRELTARQEAERRAKIVLDASPVGASLWLRGVGIIDCNEEMLRMFGLTSKSEYVHDRYDPDPEFQPDGVASKERRAELINAAKESGYQRFEWMYRLPSGEPLPTEVTLVRVPWQGDWCIAAYSRDLRETREKERQRQEAEEHAKSLEVLSKAAQMNSQAKSEFLARMSHELRTPLNAVIGFLRLELQKDLPAETIDRLKISLDSCCNLLRLINDILDISKIEAGRFELTNNDYRLADLLTEVISINASRMEDKPITFHMEVDPNLPSILHGDDLRIKQVLNNLLTNAFKYTRKGTVTLTVEPATGGDEQAGRLPIRFSIRDTGQGIKAENLGKLFNSYTRFDSEANRLIEGSGLGLAISKSLVEMMDGRIEVESVYGKGSVFSCIIAQTVIDTTPLGAAAVRSLVSLRDTGRHRQNRPLLFWRCAHLPYARVLVVDDVPANLVVAKAMLERYGMTIDCVASGLEAIELIRDGKSRYNAIFMDHMMPDMDGIETLRRIRGIDSPQAGALPVIILTANVIDGNEKMFLEQGFQAFISKPIDPAQLDAVINKWVKDAQQEVDPGSPKIWRSDTARPDASIDEITAPAAANSAVPALAGLDMREAVPRLGGEAIFFDVLRSYAANMPDLLERTRRLAEKEAEGFTIAAHGVKRTSANVGAHDLGDMAEELERAAANKDWLKVRQRFPSFFTAAATLLRDIDALLHEYIPTAAAKGD